MTFDSFTASQLNYSTPTLGGPLAWDHTVGSGSDRTLVVAISFEDSNSTATVLVGGVSFGSQPLTLLGNARMDSGSASPGGVDNQVSLWYLANPDVGQASITVAGLTVNSSNNNVKGHAGSFFEVGGITGFATASGSGGTTSLSFPGLASGSAVFAAANNSGATVGFTSVDLTMPFATLQLGGSSSQGGYALVLSEGATASFAGPSGGRTPMIGVALTAIPESSSLLLGTLGLAGLLRRRRSH